MTRQTDVRRGAGTGRRCLTAFAAVVATAALGVGLAAPAAAAPAPAQFTPGQFTPGQFTPGQFTPGQLPIPQPSPPLDRPGPALSVPQAQLDAALECEDGTSGSSRPVALFIPGTTLDPEDNFSWNYFRAFDAADRPYCSVELPNRAMSDIQVSAEYVVNAIRKVQERSGQKVAIVGFSQGGMIGRWALRFWPDTRSKVGEVIGLDPSNHGTLDSYPICALPGGCAPAFWQQQTFSRFTTALNSRTETFAGIDYTSIYTPTDEVVTPNLPPAPSSGLYTGPGNKANISTWDVCPGHLADHLSMGSIDAVGYALVLDALDNAGTARASRVGKAVCAQPFHEGVDPVTGPARFTQYVAEAGAVAVTYPRVPAEPPLKPYARG